MCRGVTLKIFLAEFHDEGNTDSQHNQSCPNEGEAGPTGKDTVDSAVSRYDFGIFIYISVYIFLWPVIDTGLRTAVWTEIAGYFCTTVLTVRHKQ